MDLVWSSKVIHLARTFSDHAPLLLSCHDVQCRKKGSFKFLKMWTMHNSFQELVLSSWSIPIQGSPLIVFWRKLKRLKSAILEWNQNTFGNVQSNILKLEDQIQKMKIQTMSSNDEDLNQLNKKYQEALNFECAYWQQKFGLEWAESAASNSKLFKALATQTKKSQTILNLKNDQGVWIYNEEEISNQAIQYFQDLFTHKPAITNVPQELQICFLRQVTELQNISLCAIPSHEEVKTATFQLNSNKSPGPDGYSGLFYQNYWEVIQWDLVEAVQSVFKGDNIPKFFTSNLISLIPKSDHAASISDYRPISLTNYFTKIPARIISNN